MKNTNKITLCGVMAALSVAVMLLSYFPYLTYAIPAIAGLFILVCVLETNCKWAFGSFLAASFLVFLFAEPESKIMFIFFFGHYPILKALIERKNFSLIIEWLLKLVIFNICVATAYLLFSLVFVNTIADFGELGKYGALVILALGNIVFIIYDFAVSRLVSLYYHRLHHKIKKLFKN